MPIVLIKSKESVSSVAMRHGYFPEAIWNHQRNKQIRDQVESMDTEAEGYRLWLPTKSVKTSNTKTGRKTVVNAKGKPEVKCKYCDEPIGQCPRKPDGVKGNNRGNGVELRKRIWYGKHQEHPWWQGSGSLQAHHLICTEALKPTNWKQQCRDFCYDVDRGLNGVMLPNKMPLACHLAQPLHRGNHNADNYTQKVDQLLKSTLSNMGDYCSAGCDAFREDMDSISNSICKKIDAFSMKLTWDGDHYDEFSDEGCSECHGVAEKQSQNAMGALADCAMRATDAVHSDDYPELASFRQGGRKRLKPADEHIRPFTPTEVDAQ